MAHKNASMNTKGGVSLGKMKGAQTAPPSSKAEAKAIKQLSKNPGNPVKLEGATAKQAKEVTPDQLRG